MSTPDCEQIKLAALARADGEPATVSAEVITAHLAGCDRCRNEIEPLLESMALLDLQTRSVDSREVWRLIEQRVRGASQPARWEHGWKLPVVLAPALLGYKLLEQLASEPMPFIAKLVPLVFAVAVFALLIGENPFRINTELKLEGDQS